MSKKESPSEGAIQDLQCKDSKSLQNLQRIKEYFLDGEKGTIPDIITATRVINPMKAINRLRSQGWKICKCVQGGLNFYWLDHEQRTKIINGTWEGGEACPR